MAAACLRRLRRIPHPLLQPAAANHFLFPSPAAKAALVTQPCPSAADRVEAPLSILRPGFACNGNFKHHQWHHKLGSSVGAVLIGHAAFFLGLSNGSAFAQEDSLSPAAASEHAEGNAPGLQRIEDGSVVSNEHTVKWRIYTDNGREFFQKRQLDEAEKLFHAALQEAKEGFGLRDPHVTSSLNNLVLSLQGKRKNAECLAEESIRILEEAGLGDSPTCIQRMRYLSRELIKSKRFAEAEIWQRKILHSLELSKGWDSLDTAHAAELLSLNLETMEKFKESEELLERCLAVKKKVLPEDHLQVALTLVYLARLTLHKVVIELGNANSDVIPYYLAKAKQLCNDSIRITEGRLNSSRKDQNKINSTSSTDTDNIAAAIVLLEALNVFGLLDITAKYMLGQGFQGQDCKSVEDVLRKCISLYKEPHTRRLLKKAVKQHYMICLRSLIDMVQLKLPVPQMMGLQELLGEAEKIIGELAEESSST